MQRLAQGAEHLRVNQPRVRPAHLDFRGVYVHVHRLRIHGEKHEDHRVTLVLDQAAIGLLDRVMDEPIAHVSPVDEGVLPLRTGPRVGGRGEVGLEPHAALIPLDVQHRGRQLRAVALGDALDARLTLGQLLRYAVVVAHLEAHGGVGQGQSRHLLVDVSHLGGVGAQELSAGGHVEKQIAHLDGGARRGPDRAGGFDLLGANLNLMGGECCRRSRHDPQPRHRRDAGQCFPAKPHRGDAV